MCSTHSEGGMKFFRGVYLLNKSFFENTNFCEKSKYCPEI